MKSFDCFVLEMVVAICGVHVWVGGAGYGIPDEDFVGSEGLFDCSVETRKVFEKLITVGSRILRTY